MSATETMSVTPLRDGVAEEIRSVMARKRVTGSELARRMHATQAYVWRRVSGEKAPDVDDLHRIAAALGVPVVDLLPPSASRVIDETKTSHGRRPHVPRSAPRRPRTPRRHGRRPSTRPGRVSPDRRRFTPYGPNHLHIRGRTFTVRNGSMT